MNDDRQIRIDSQDARAGATPHVTRYVLTISMALAILAMFAVWLFGHA